MTVSTHQLTFIYFFSDTVPRMAPGTVGNIKRFLTKMVKVHHSWVKGASTVIAGALSL